MVSTVPLVLAGTLPMVEYGKLSSPQSWQGGRRDVSSRKTLYQGAYVMYTDINHEE